MHVAEKKEDIRIFRVKNRLRVHFFWQKDISKEEL
jgi:hypothetical protein